MPFHRQGSALIHVAADEAELVYESVVDSVEDNEVSAEDVDLLGHGHRPG